MLSGPEHNRPDDEMHLVNKSRSKVLPNGRYAAAQANVAPARRRGRLFPRRAYAAGDKAKLGASCHLERCP